MELLVRHRLWAPTSSLLFEFDEADGRLPSFAIDCSGLIADNDCVGERQIVSPVPVVTGAGEFRILE